MHHKAIWPLEKRARRGFKGYPVATVAFYGPDDRRATKVAVGILMSEGVEAAQIVEFIDEHGAKSVALADHILGCVHEEGIDIRREQSARIVRSGRTAIVGQVLCSNERRAPYFVKLALLFAIGFFMRV